MKAPVYAYAIKDDSFVKLPIQEGSTLHNIFVARFLSGAQSEGGYSTSAEQMRQNVKTLFHLDEVLDVGEEQDDGTAGTVGFVGAVRQGGMNAQHHNLAKRQSGVVLGDGGDALLLLNDAGLNCLPYAEGVVVKFAFLNYFKFTWRVHSTFYDSATYEASLSVPGLEDARQVSGSITKRSSAEAAMVNTGGMAVSDTPGESTLTMEVTGDEGTRTFTASVQMLDILNFEPFVPVENQADVPVRNDPGIVTMLVDRTFAAGIAEHLADKNVPSAPEQITQDIGGSRDIMLLGVGALPGTADEEDLENYYNAVTTGSGTYPRPADGHWVCITPIAVSMEWVYYGITIQDGAPTYMWRSRTPQSDLPDIVLNISVTKTGTNTYSVVLSLSAPEGTGQGSASVHVSALYVRRTQTGAALGGQFRNSDGSVFSGTTLGIGYSSGGLQPVGSVTLTLTTAEATPFWVTADATIDNASYELVNNGTTTSGSPSGPTEPTIQ